MPFYYNNGCGCCRDRCGRRRAVDFFDFDRRRNDFYYGGYYHRVVYIVEY